jgi:hypothetical protein
MSQRDSESFDIEDEFLSEASEEPSDYDKFLDRMDKRARPAAQAVKKGKAAWSKLEEVLAEKKLEKDLRDVYDDEL